MVRIDQGLRGTGLCGLGMEGCGLRHGQGPLGGDSIGPNSTDRAKAGSKRRILVDRSGGPLSVVVAGANVHDTGLLAMTLESIVVEHSDSDGDGIQHLCLDKGYDNPTGHQSGMGHRYQGRVRRIGEENLDLWGVCYPARRWVVERTLAWVSKCRAMLVRYDKKVSNYMGLIQLACARLWYRRQCQLKLRDRF